jgi:hypothetical protein
MAQHFGNKGSYLVYGGGHGNYFGSEVYAFDLETCYWSRITDPCPQVSGVFPNAEYSDGSPLPPHTYDFVEYHPGTNSFVLLRGITEMGPPSNSVTVGIMHMLNLDSLKWRRSPKNTGDNLYSGGFSAYDSRRDVFWVEGGSGAAAFVKYDPNGQNGDGTFGSFQNYTKKLGMTDSQAEYEPNKDLFVITGFRDGSSVYAVDLSNPTSSRVTLNEGGTPPSKSSTCGWTWSDRRQAILYYYSGADVYEFKAPAGDWKTEAWTWTKLTSSSNSVTPENWGTNGRGPYSRFRIAQYTDAEVAIIVHKIDNIGQTYAFRVPGGSTHVEIAMPTLRGLALSASPNPFRTGTVFTVKLPGNEKSALNLYDMKGRLVRTLETGIGKKGGIVRVCWDGRDRYGAPAPAGVYLAGLRTKGGRAVTKQVVLVR